MDASLPRRQRERALAHQRLRLYTKRIAFGSGALAVVLAVIAAQSNPGRAGSQSQAAQSSQSVAGSDQQQTLQDQSQNQGQNSLIGGGGLFGSGGGGPVAVTGGS